MTTPRGNDGRPMKHLGRGFYVLVNEDGREVSERAPGEAWLAFEHLNRMTLVLHPDHTDANGLVPLTLLRQAGPVQVAIGLEDQGVVYIEPHTHLLRAHDNITVDWRSMLDAMS